MTVFPRSLACRILQSSARAADTSAGRGCSLAFQATVLKNTPEVQGYPLRQLSRRTDTCFLCILFQPQMTEAVRRDRQFPEPPFIASSPECILE